MEECGLGSFLCQLVSLEGTGKDMGYLLPVVAGLEGRAEVSPGLVDLEVSVRCPQGRVESALGWTRLEFPCGAQGVDVAGC